MVRWVHFWLFVAYLITGFKSQADFIDMGYMDIKYELFNFYNKKTPTGKYIKQTYENYYELRTDERSFEKLPSEFEPLVSLVHTYVQANSLQKSYANDKNQFYVGENGVNNGSGFTFDFDELPTKIVRLAFCFGLDPLIFTALIHQESMFSRNAKSDTGASGFTQLTSQAIAEVSEQLDILGRAFRSEGSVEFLNQSISCYYGPHKKWVNMWEDGTIPKGKEAYKKLFTGNGRKWHYEAKSKAWLNHDPDRNLIYGAIYFKSLLNRKPIKRSYSRALLAYNVGQKDIYLSRINGYYDKMAPELFDNLSITRKKSLHAVNFQIINYQRGEYDCNVPNDDSSWHLPAFAWQLYEDDEILDTLLEEWVYRGLCKKKFTHL